MYYVQACYADSRLVFGDIALHDEHSAIRVAVRIMQDPTFEGEYVRVITCDGESQWDSRECDLFGRFNRGVR